MMQSKSMVERTSIFTASRVEVIEPCAISSMWMGKSHTLVDLLAVFVLKSNFSRIM